MPFGNYPPTGGGGGGSGGGVASSVHFLVNQTDPSAPNAQLVSSSSPLPPTQGGVGLTALPSAGKLLGTNLADTGYEGYAVTAGGGISIVQTDGSIVIGNTASSDTDIPIPVPVASGGTGLTSIVAAGKLLGSNLAGTAYEGYSIAAGSGISVNETEGVITITNTSSGGGGSSTTNAGYIVTKGNLTLTDSSPGVVICDSTSGGIAITMPAGNTVSPGRKFLFVAPNDNVTSNTISVNINDGYWIDGSSPSGRDSVEFLYVPGQSFQATFLGQVGTAGGNYNWAFEPSFGEGFPAGSFNAISTTNANLTLTFNDGPVINVSNGIALTLPDLTLAFNAPFYIIRNIDGTDCTITGSAGQTVDGLGTYHLDGNGHTVLVNQDNTGNWVVSFANNNIQAGTGISITQSNNTLVVSSTAVATTVSAGNGIRVTQSGSNYTVANTASSFSGITGTAQINQGGTGLTSAGASGTLLGTAPNGTSLEYWQLVAAGSLTITQAGSTITITDTDSGGSTFTILPVVSGGTGLGVLGPSGTFLGVNTSGTALEYWQILAGSGISLTQSGSSLTIIGNATGTLPGPAGANLVFMTNDNGTAFEQVTLTAGNGISIATGGANVTITNQQAVNPTSTITSSTSLTTNSATFNACDATSGNILITLPAGGSNEGLGFLFKRVDATANTVTLQVSGGGTIDGAATQTLNIQYKATAVMVIGGNWYIT